IGIRCQNQNARLSQPPFCAEVVNSVDATVLYSLAEAYNALLLRRVLISGKFHVENRTIRLVWRIDDLIDNSLQRMSNIQINVFLVLPTAGCENLKNRRRDRKQWLTIILNDQYF